MSELSSATLSLPVLPTSLALKITSGIPLSIQVTSISKGSKPDRSCVGTTRTLSLTLPVGRSEEQTEPAVSKKLIVMGAEEPGAPSILASPE